MTYALFLALASFAVLIWLLGALLGAVIQPLFQRRPKPVAPPPTSKALVLDYDVMHTVQTYDEVARTLPLQIVEAIEDSRPCSGAASGRHAWVSTTTEDRSQLGVVRLRQTWGCALCSRATSTNPHRQGVTA